VLLKYAPHLLVNHLVSRASDDTASRTRYSGAVVFVDIVESTALTDQFSRQGSDGAERLASVLNGYFGRIIDITDAHGGDTFRIDGDAAVLLWCDEGATAQSSVIAAAAAALALRDETGEPAAAPGLEVRQRISIVAGSIDLIVFTELNGRGHCIVDGAPIRQLGDPLLRGLPGQIIVSDETRAILADAAVLVPAACGGYELAGMSERHGAIEAIRDRPQRATDPALESRVRAFVPKVIVDRTQAGQSEWIAEFRKLTAIFVDLRGLDRGALDIAERVEGAVRSIAAIVDTLGIPITNIVANEKGLIVQIACGLPPYAQEHGAQLAVRAALHIRQALTAVGIPAAIGISTGEAFCGDIGSAGRREYLSTGLVMAYAARLMQAADDEIVCDEATARAAMGQAEFSAAREIMVKGRAYPLPIRSVRDVARPGYALAMHAGALFGRETEFAIVQQRLAGLAEGQGGVLAIEAEPGAGKTHLLAHAADAAHGLGYPTAMAVTSPIEETTPYFSLRRLLSDLTRGESDPPELPLELLRERIAGLVVDPRVVARLALLEDVLPLQFADKGLAPEIKGQARLSGIEEILIHLLSRRTARTPMVIVVDDVQWLDASSAHVLSSLLLHVPRALAIVANRPVDASTSSHVASLLAAAKPLLRLPRLSAAAIEAIVRERVGTNQVEPRLVDFIHSRSEGLPFFAEQLLFALRDHGVLRVEDGQCSVSGSELPEMAAPDSLRELIVSRVDRLPPERQLAIKVASAIGRVFDVETVHDVHPLEVDRAALDDALDRLSDAGLLSRSSDLGRPVFAFRHGIIQGVTYELLPFAQRRPLHRSIALHLEAKYQGALTPHFAALADHWERAAEPARAIPFCIGAADMAAQRYANRDALNHLDRAERLAGQLGGLKPSELAHCVRIRADACQELTRFSEAHEHYRKLAALEGIRVPRTRMETILVIARESALQALRRAGLMRALSHGDEQVRDGLAAHIYMRLAEHAYFTNDTLRLAQATLASLNHAERADALPEIVNASGGLALGLAALGLLRWASHYRERSIDLANHAGSPSAQGFAELLACVQSFHTGDWDRMGVHGARGARIWKELGDRYRHQACLVLEGYRMMATGCYDRADRALAAFGEKGEEIESVQVRAWALAARALLDLVLGRPPAIAIARLATASAAGNLNPAESLLCNGIAAAAYLEAGDRAAALRSATSGLANVTEGSPAMAGALLFSVPSIAEVLLVLAQEPEGTGRSRDELLALSKSACRAAQHFAARNRICRPRASLLRGRLAATRGRSRRSEDYYTEALADAKRMGLPLEEAMSHLALAQTGASATARDAHRHEASEILQRLGVVWAPWQRFHH
jgi:predicted ATPase